MRLNQLIECQNCMEVDAPSNHGSCRTCGSYAVVWIAGQTSWTEPVVEREGVLCGCDREFLREMGIEN